MLLPLPAPKLTVEKTQAKQDKQISIMRKIVLFHLVLLLSLCTQSDPAFALKHVPAADLYGDIVKDSSTENPEDTDMATTITAKGIYTDGDVTLGVTKATDGTYYLYDSNRKVGVKIGTKLPALDELVEQGKFYVVSSNVNT